MNKYHLELKLRKDHQNNDGTFTIQLYVNLNGKVKYFTTNQSVLQQHWNKSKKQVSTSADNWSRINSNIASLKNRAESFINLANAEGKLINAMDLERVLRAGYNTNSYFDFVENYILKFGINYSSNTLRNFKSEIKTIKSFRPELDFTHINPIFWKRFETFLLKKGNAQNTIHKFFKNIRKFLNKAVEFGVIESNPLKGVKVKQTEGRFNFLQIDELKKLDRIYTTGLLTNQKQRNALQCFLFACYTGLRYSDVRDLRFSNILNLNDPEKTYIEKIIFKTNEVERVPLNLLAWRLIPKDILPHQPVFRVYSNQVLNRTLKEIIILAEIDKKVSFHVARHTAATLLLDLSGNIEAVKKILGHKKIQTTEIYAKVLDKNKRSIVQMMDSM